MKKGLDTVSGKETALMECLSVMSRVFWGPDPETCAEWKEGTPLKSGSFPAAFVSNTNSVRLLESQRDGKVVVPYLIDHRVDGIQGGGQEQVDVRDLCSYQE